ncbi:MAG TPA: glucuronate isomerase [Bryobacteraceae bacterium]|jgi:hypothetical protein
MLKIVQEELATTPFIDIHTHLFKPSLGALGLWGIDELLTYHYLEAELFRSCDITPARYWSMSKTEQADLIWQTLFVDNLPVSESTRGVTAVLKAFDLPTASKDLTAARKFFASRKLESHIEEVFKLADITEVVMTNDPLDPNEAPLWEKRSADHNQFHAVLRLDRVLKSGKSVPEAKEFLAEWSERMRPVYMAVSLPDTFQYPEESPRAQLLREAVLPACRELNIPLSLMIGVRLQVNPAIKLAGDAVGRADLRALENLCRDFPDNRFLVSVLSRENQHELCVYARKFSNLMPFGCWWFLNNPSIVEEMTRERIEMLGMSFIPQHSDARVLEQVIYKWRNTRRTLAPILANTYSLLSEDGRAVTRDQIRHDINRLFRANFESFTRPSP